MGRRWHALRKPSLVSCSRQITDSRCRHACCRWADEVGAAGGGGGGIGGGSGYSPVNKRRITSYGSQAREWTCVAGAPGSAYWACERSRVLSVCRLAGLLCPLPASLHVLLLPWACQPAEG